MTLSIVENLSASFEFAKNGLVDHLVRWAILIVVSFIPIVNFIASGYLVRIYRGGDSAPELEDYVEMFIDGIKLFIIGLIYLLIPLILIFAGMFLSGVGLVAMLEGGDAAIGVGAGSMATGLMIMLFGLLLFLIFGMVAVVGCIRFAKTEQCGEGLNFRAVLDTLADIGWAHYILSYIVFVIVSVIIFTILGMIPFLGWLLTLIMMPFFLVWQGKFFENLYSCA